jgi:Glycogen recognition site of AMP-activated protein kinase
MTDAMKTPDDRLDAALKAMREPTTVDPDRVARVAARAVLANAPTVRTNRWALQAAAAIAVVALGAAALRSNQAIATPEADGAIAADAPAAEVRRAVTITPVIATGARPIVFELSAPNAQSVQVLGDFNQWSRNVNSMERGSDGRWRLTTMLPPGRYVYAFLVDGRRFERDPVRDAIEDRDFGVTGSELVVGEAP